jgi:hypothetical protein
VILIEAFPLCVYIARKAETCSSINNIVTDNKLVVFLTSLHCTFMGGKVDM